MTPEKRIDCWEWQGSTKQKEESDIDYKKLINRLDNCTKFDGDLLDKAADAIGTLLAERGAATEKRP